MQYGQKQPTRHLKRLLLIAAIALICPLTGTPRASAQSAQFSYSNFSGVGMTYVAGSSFAFDITLNFTSGGAIANVNGLSYWMNQNTPAGAPFVFAITLRDATGSFFTDLQTPGI